MTQSMKNLTNLLQANSQDAGEPNATHARYECCLAIEAPYRSKPLLISVWPWLLILMLVFGVQSASAQTTWSMGYYYPTSGANPPLSSIQWSALTHVGMVGGNPNSDGTITLTPSFASYATALIATARASNVKVLYVVASPSFTAAVQNHESTLIANIMSTVNTYGFDGVDIDYEEAWNATVITTLHSDLRTALGTKLLSSTTGAYQFSWSGSGPTPVCGGSSTSGGWTAAQAAYLDRLTLLTYDLGNPGNGDPYTWFNSPLYSVAGQYLWSVDYEKQAASNPTSSGGCGIPASKLNIGIPFYADLYTVNTAPYQSLGTGSTVTQMGYNSFAASYGISSYTQDSTGHVPWKASGGRYLSWEDAASITDKINYVRTNGLGGWVIWVLGWDYTSGASPQMPLLDAIGKASASRPQPPTGLQVVIK
jgi:chitinase